MNPLYDPNNYLFLFNCSNRDVMSSPQNKKYETCIMHLSMRDTVSGFIRGSQEASAIYLGFTYFDKSNAQGINASLLDLQVGLKLGCWAVYIYIYHIRHVLLMGSSRTCISCISIKYICLPTQLSSWEVKCK